MKRLSVALFVMAVALLAAACGDDQSTDAGEPDGPLGFDGAWVLTAAAVDDMDLVLLDEHRVTMTIEGDVMGGRGACNGYGGAVTIDDGEVTVGDLSWTAMACVPEAMAIESAFLSALPRITEATRAGDTAELVGDGVTLSFVLLDPVPIEGLVGTTWRLDAIVDGDTVRSVVAGAEGATLLLLHDGTIRAGTGCRELLGEYLLTGDTVQLTSFGAEGECGEELRAQDGDVISRLEGGFRVALDGDRLELVADGGEGLRYVAS